MENAKISSHQMSSFTASYTCGTSILVVSSSLAGFAKQDAWMCSLFSVVIGIPFVLLYCYLGKLFPDKSLLEVIITVFGKWIGWIVSAFFVFLCLLSAAQVVSYIGSFMTTEYLISTPVYLINALFLAILVLALFYGLESASRATEILFRMVWIILLFTVVANIPNFKINNLFPVLENGVTPVFKGSILLSSYMTWPLIVLNMAYPTHVDNPKAARRSILKGYLWGSAVIFLINLTSILVLGSNITAITKYPTYMLAKEISFGFLSRIEGLIIGAWIVTLLSRTFFYLYAGLTGMSKLFGLKDNKKIILPLGFLVLLFSNIAYPSSAYQVYWDKIVWIPYIATISIILPLALFVVYLLRKFYVK